MNRYPGQVARIRISPTDLMSVVDVVEAIGMRQPGMSFSSMVSIALSSCLESLRQSDIIPVREGYEYNDIRNSVIIKKSKSALVITDAFQARGSDYQIPVPKKGLQFVKRPEELLSQNGTIEEKSQEDITTEQRLSRRRLSELVAKQELVESNAPGVLWSQEDQREFEQLCQLVYGA